MFIKGECTAVLWAAEYIRGLQWGRTRDCWSGEAGRETQRVGLASHLQKERADGSPDRVVGKEMLKIAITRGTPGAGNYQNS